MNLVIDIGNSRVKVGVFDQDKLIRKAVLDAGAFESLAALVQDLDITHLIQSSVGAYEMDTEFLAVKGFHLKLDELTPLPVKMTYETPGTLGRDRIAAVTGAFAQFPGEDVLVIDAGTCITYDLLTADGVHQGGNIAPGLTMRFDAMHSFTARLPLVKRDRVSRFLGRNTHEAVRNGGIFGALLEIEGYIARCFAEHPFLNVILTGGDAAYFGEMLKTQIFVLPDLVLTGLNEILLFNEAKQK